MSVQLFVPSFRVEECLEQVKECLEKGWTGLGFKTLEIENAWKDYTQLNNAYFLNSATSGLHMAVHQLKEKHQWNDGDEIITTPLTFVSSNHAIVYENMKPVFADVDDTLCLSPESIVKQITPKTRAVMYVAFGGNSGRLDDVVRVCKENNLKLIFDGAHAAGTQYNGRHIGGEADVSVFSFQAVKNMPTADAGMICWNDDEMDAAARKLGWLGINKDTYARTVSGKANYKWMYDVENVGFKYHGNSIMAGLALTGLKYLDEDNGRRREIADSYRSLLKDCDALQFVEQVEVCQSSTHLFQVMVEHRDEVLTYLNSKDIFPGVHYRSNCEYRMYEYGKGTCPRAEAASHKILSLPLHMKLTMDDIKYVAETLIEATNAVGN